MPLPPAISRSDIQRISAIAKVVINGRWPSLSRREERKDILQDVLTILWRNHRSAFEGNFEGKSARSLIANVTASVCKARIRKMLRRENKLGPIVRLVESDKRKLIIPDLEMPESTPSFSPQLTQALKRLSPNEREIFLSHVVDGKSFLSLGRTLGRNPTSIHDSFVRAQARLQRFTGAPIFSPKPRKSPVRKSRYKK